MIDANLPHQSKKKQQTNKLSHATLREWIVWFLFCGVRRVVWFLFCGDRRKAFFLVTHVALFETVQLIRAKDDLNAYTCFVTFCGFYGSHLDKKLWSLSFLSWLELLLSGFGVDFVTKRNEFSLQCNISASKCGREMPMILVDSFWKELSVEISLVQSIGHDRECLIVVLVIVPSAATGVGAWFQIAVTLQGMVVGECRLS